MRKWFESRILTGVLAAALLCTTLPETAYATEVAAETVETVQDQTATEDGQPETAVEDDKILDDWNISDEDMTSGNEKNPEDNKVSEGEEVSEGDKPSVDSGNLEDDPASGDGDAVEGEPVIGDENASEVDAVPGEQEAEKSEDGETEIQEELEYGIFDDEVSKDDLTAEIETETEHSTEMAGAETYIAEQESDVRAASDITRDAALAWVNSAVGQQLDYDRRYGAQCVDLIYYYYAHLGATVLGGNASAYATNALPAGWRRISYNSNVKDVQPGDIAVWTGTSTGHVAIVVSADANGFNVAEQNYAAGADGTYDYGDVPCAIRYHAGYRHYNGGSLLNCVIRPNFKADTTHKPTGFLEPVVGGAGCITVRGWAYDPDIPTQSLVIDVYIGGGPGTGVPYHRFLADKSRPDVGSAYPGIGNYHGFSETIKTEKTGEQDVYVYALNVGEGNDNPLIGQRKVTISQDRVEGVSMQTGYSRVLPDGYYHIASSLGDQWWLVISGMSKDNGANVAIYDYSIRDFDCDEQLFYFKFIDGGGGKGFYQITNKLSGKCLAVEGDSQYMRDQNGNLTNVCQLTKSGSSGQQWAIREVDGGTKGIMYTLKARCSGFCLDLWGGEANLRNEANVSMFTDNGTSAQQWRIVPYAPAIGKTIEDGEYQLVCYADGNKAAGTSESGNGANIVLNSSYKGSDKQIFDVKYLGNGSYRIVHKQTGLSLDVAGTYRALGTNVWLWNHLDYDAQKWIIQSCGGGCYNVISKCNGLYLHLDGTNINVLNWGTGSDIKWKFVPYVKQKMRTPAASYVNGAELKAGTKIYFESFGADEVYFTMDGTVPTRQSTKYSPYKISGIELPGQQESCTIRAFAAKEGYEDSSVVTYTYKIKQKTPEESEPGGEDPAVPGGEDPTVPGGEEPTVPGGEDPTVPGGEDPTVPGGEDPTVPGGEDPTVPSGEDPTVPGGEDPTVPGGEDPTVPGGEDPTVPGGEDPAVPVDDDLQDGVKWHYDEQNVAYKDLAALGEIVTSIRPKIYDGTAYKPTVKVTAVENGKTITLTEGTDYRVLYFNNIHAGTATVTVKGNGVYKGTISRNFEIKKKPCKKVTVLTDGMLIGDASKPKVYVYDGSVLLKENKDYTLDGITSNLTAAKGRKRFYVKATPDSDYEGTATAYLTVYDADQSRIQGVIDNPEAVKLSQNTYSYTGKACKPTAVVTVNGQTLTAGKDYNITYKNNKEKGIAFAIITGKGAYAGSVVKEFTIGSSDGEFTLKKPIAAVAYNGKLQKPKLIVMANGKTLKLNKDYTLTYTNNLHVTDRAKVTVRGKGSYTNIPTKAFYFIINPCHIKKASVKGRQGSLTVTHAKHTLVEGVDYDILYGDAVGKNKITVTIKAKEGSSFTGEVIKRINKQ